MRIAYIGLRGIPAAYSGVEQSVEEIGSRLVAKGHNVTVFCMSNRYKNKLRFYKGIALKYVFTFQSKHLEMIWYAFLCTIICIFSKYDIIHFHALGPSTMAFIVKFLKKNTVVTVHGLDWKRAKWGRLARAYLLYGEKSSVEYADKTIAVSNVLKKYLERKYQKKVIYITNGVNINSPIRSKYITRYGLTANDYLLFVGRLVPEKGCHYLIEAFKRLKTDKKLVIVGESAASDKYVDSLRSSAPNNVVFTGFLAGNDLTELYSNAYMYIQPSEIEGLPISVLEAMSYGRCVLVSDIEENIEAITMRNGDRCGETFKNKCPTDLKKKIEFLLEHKELLEKYGNQAISKVQKEHNWDSITDETFDVYSSLFYN